jgi:hypothetical protein
LVKHVKIPVAEQLHGIVVTLALSLDLIQSNLPEIFVIAKKMAIGNTNAAPLPNNLNLFIIP